MRCYTRAMDPVPPAPPQPAPQPQPVTPPETPKSKLWLWMLGGILLLATGTTGGIFLGKRLYTQPLRQPTPSPSVTSVQEGDPTANWKTYTNSKDGYLINYPSILEITDNSNIGGYVGFAFPMQDNWSASLTIKIWPNPQKLSAQKYYDSQVAKSNFKPISKSSTTINELDAYQVVAMAGDGDMLDTYIAKGQEVVEISFYKNQSNDPNHIEHFNFFAQILSTFKFTGQSSDTSNWKTYTNDKYYYSYKYPPDWFIQESQDDKTLSQLTNYNPNDYSLHANVNIFNPGDIKMHFISNTSDFISEPTSNLSTIVFANNTAKQITQSKPELAANNHYDISKVQTIFVDRNGLRYAIGFILGNNSDKQEVIAQKILSTFKFTN